MYVALGFFAAGLVAIAIIPAIWRRAVRLTRQAIEASNPLSLSDARAEIDAIRASHAIDYRRLEKNLDRMRAELVNNRILRDRAEAHASAMLKERDENEKAIGEAIARGDDVRREAGALEAQLARANLEIRDLQRKLDNRSRAYAELLDRRQKTGEMPPTGQEEPDLSADEAQSDFASANDAAALARIASLESETAALREKLKKAEEALASAPKTPSDMLAESSGKARREQQKAIDNKLFDMETRYIAAQAEITRLTLRLERFELGDEGESDQPSVQNSAFEALQDENDRLRDMLDGKADFSTLRDTLKNVAAGLTAELADDADLAILGGMDESAAPVADNKTLASRIMAARRRMSSRAAILDAAQDPDNKRKREA